MPRGRKKQVKTEEAPVKKKELTQHLFRKDRVSDKEKQGWKVVGEHKDKRQMDGSDLVLMEKKV